MFASFLFGRLLQALSSGDWWINNRMFITTIHQSRPPPPPHHTPNFLIRLTCFRKIGLMEWRKTVTSGTCHKTFSHRHVFEKANGIMHSLTTVFFFFVAVGGRWWWVGEGHRQCTALQQYFNHTDPSLGYLFFLSVIPGLPDWLLFSTEFLWEFLLQLAHYRTILYLKILLFTPFLFQSFNSCTMMSKFCVPL